MTIIGLARSQCNALISWWRGRWSGTRMGLSSIRAACARIEPGRFLQFRGQPENVVSSISSGHRGVLPVRFPGSGPQRGVGPCRCAKFACRYWPNARYRGRTPATCLGGSCTHAFKCLASPVSFGSGFPSGYQVLTGPADLSKTSAVSTWKRPREKSWTGDATRSSSAASRARF